MVKGTAPMDRELEAIGLVFAALEPLEGEAIQRVLEYVLRRLSIATPSLTKPASTITTVPSSSPVHSTVVTRGHQPSIRDLKEEKQPESANQMAALVAYYLSEVADESERKYEVNTSDLRKYFKQAGFKLPKKLPQTLTNATAAGYFDASGSGRYTLNAVGYNLVVHGLPRSGAAKDAVRRPARKKAGAKRKASLRSDRS